MSDVGDILGLKRSASHSSIEANNAVGSNKALGNYNNAASISTATKTTGSAAGQQSNKKPKTQKGMNRELIALMGDDSIAPSIQTSSNLNIGGYKTKKISLNGKWTWAPIRHPVRKDDLVLNHWARVDIQDVDYAYAKFNVKLEPIEYTDEEYDTLLQQSNWTRSETDHLMYICYQYDLRWPVIVDRYEPVPPRTAEELMGRYYFILAKLKANRSGIAEYSQRCVPSVTFDFNHERMRRTQLELSFRMNPEDEIDEAKIKEEIKTVDAQLKKMKKAVKPADSATKQSASVQRSNSTSSLNDMAAKDQKPYIPVMPPISMYNNGHLPAAGTPCLQSGRLMLQESNLNLSKTFIKKLQLLSAELGVPEKPLPTKNNCDMLDNVLFI